MHEILKEIWSSGKRSRQKNDGSHELAIFLVCFKENVKLFFLQTGRDKVYIKYCRRKLQKRNVNMFKAQSIHKYICREHGLSIQWTDTDRKISLGSLHDAFFFPTKRTRNMLLDLGSPGIAVPTKILGAFVPYAAPNSSFSSFFCFFLAAISFFLRHFPPPSPPLPSPPSHVKKWR